MGILHDVFIVLLMKRIKHSPSFTPMSSGITRKEPPGAHQDSCVSCQEKEKQRTTRGNRNGGERNAFAHAHSDPLTVGTGSGVLTKRA